MSRCCRSQIYQEKFNIETMPCYKLLNIILVWSSLITLEGKRKKENAKIRTITPFHFCLLISPLHFVSVKEPFLIRNFFSKNVETTVLWDRSLYIPVEGFGALSPFFLVLTFVSQAADLSSSLSRLKKKSKYAIIEKLHYRFWHCVPDLIRYNITEHILWVKIGYAILPDKNSSFCKTKISCFVWERKKTKISSMFDAFILNF